MSLGVQGLFISPAIPEYGRVISTFQDLCISISISTAIQSMER
jgi:hypothetical protein